MSRKNKAVILGKTLINIGSLIFIGCIVYGISRVSIILAIAFIALVIAFLGTIIIIVSNNK